MKKALLLIITIALANTLTAQIIGGGKPHKIIFQLATDDTLVHKVLMKQLNNIITFSPASKVEVVCQGGGLNILIAEKTIVHEKVAQLKKKNVDFVACEFAMSERKVTRDMMIPESGYVPYGLIEIVSKQEEGWSYLKAGF